MMKKSLGEGGLVRPSGLERVKCFGKKHIYADVIIIDISLKYILLVANECVLVCCFTRTLFTLIMSLTIVFCRS